jgi:hypothetical protein
MATEVTVNFIWVESGYEWEVPENWDHQIPDSL